MRKPCESWLSVKKFAKQKAALSLVGPRIGMLVAYREEKAGKAMLLAIYRDTSSNSRPFCSVKFNQVQFVSWTNEYIIKGRETRRPFERFGENLLHVAIFTPSAATWYVLAAMKIRYTINRRCEICQKLKTAWIFDLFPRFFLSVLFWKSRWGHYSSRCMGLVEVCENSWQPRLCEAFEIHFSGNLVGATLWQYFESAMLFRWRFAVGLIKSGELLRCVKSVLRQLFFHLNAVNAAIFTAQRR